MKAAILNHDELLLEQLLFAGADPNEPDSFGVVPLFHAINFGSARMVELLLRHGADKNHVCWQGRSPWFLAVENGDIETLCLLERHQADMTIANNLGNTGLHLAAMYGEPKRFAHLLRRAAADSVRRPNHAGQTLLHLAAAWHHGPVARMLLNKALVDMDAPDEAGATPFLTAIKGGHVELADLFWGFGCNIHAKDVRNNNAVTLAVKHFPDGGKHQDFIKRLLKAGVKADRVNAWNESPLWLAVAANATRVARWLLQHKANPDIAGGTRREHPANMAFNAGNVELFMALLRAGANPDLPREEGKTLLYRAVEQDRILFLRLLLRHGADIWIPYNDNRRERDKEYVTPLQRAEELKNATAERWLQHHANGGAPKQPNSKI